MYKNYIFDLYGTLVDINTNENNLVIYIKHIKKKNLINVKNTV